MLFTYILFYSNMIGILILLLLFIRRDIIDFKLTFSIINSATSSFLCYQYFNFQLPLRRWRCSIMQITPRLSFWQDKNWNYNAWREIRSRRPKYHGTKGKTNSNWVSFNLIINFSLRALKAKFNEELKKISHLYLTTR